MMRSYHFRHVCLGFGRDTMTEVVGQTTNSQETILPKLLLEDFIILSGIEGNKVKVLKVGPKKTGWKLKE